MEASTLNNTEAWVIALLLFILMLFSGFIGNSPEIIFTIKYNFVMIENVKSIYQNF